MYIFSCFVRSAVTAGNPYNDDVLALKKYWLDNRIIQWFYHVAKSDQFL